MSTRKNSVPADRKPAGCMCPEWMVEAWEDLVQRSPGIKADSIAERMGVDVSTLYDYGTKPTNLSGHHICAPFSRALPATLASGNPVLIHALTKHAGLSTPHPRHPSDESASSLMRQALKQIGVTLQDMASAMPDAPLDTTEQQRLQYNLRRLREVADLASMADQPPTIRPLRRA